MCRRAILVYWRGSTLKLYDKSMHSHTVDRLQHHHSFLGEAHARNERRTLFVVALTAAMMVVEIVGGALYGSMALVADGWHMSTHVAALGTAALAYRYARRHRSDARFSFGTGKLGELAGFGSAVVLAMIALYIGIESATRLFAPVTIAFGQAIPIAALGLTINLISAWLLHGGEEGHGGHDHEVGHAHAHHAHDHGHHHHGHDTNFRAAYVHVLADALTSLTAIIALTAGRFLGWTWLDPAMGLVGTVVIAFWALSLVRSAGATLLDMVPSDAVADRIRSAVEIDGDRITDLHLWRLGPGHAAVILSVVAAEPQEPEVYKRRLRAIGGLSHVTVEVTRCMQGHTKAA